MKEIQVGLLGLGTVGSGVVRIITDHQERLIHQVGCPVKVTKVLVQNDFTVGLANCVTFHNTSKGVYCMVHGDDFVTTGPSQSLDWFGKVFKNAFEIKTDRISSKPNVKKELKVFLKDGS